MYFKSCTLCAIALAATFVECNPTPKGQFKYVLAISVDGFHSSDVEKYVQQRPKSTIAGLLKDGYEYTNAFTAAPSDSFPGTLAQLTGAGPRTTGVWYDDAYDRTFFAPSSGCKGPAGAEVVYAENIDFNDTQLFSGGIDPAKLPQKLINGVCTNIYPHSRLRVNTIFEVAHAAGLTTAYTDKHPAYDLVRGPSGQGLSLGYFPEITGVPNTVDAVIEYDKLHVAAFLDWIKGIDPANSEGTLAGKTPRLFGGNFQSINVAEKKAGYEPKDGTPFTPTLLSTYDFIDQSLGKIVQGLKDKRIHRQTLLIVASKHGQSPIDPRKLVRIDPDAVTNATGVKVLQQTSDTLALLWLADQTATAKAVAGLQANKAALKIEDIIYGPRLIAEGFGDPLKDPAVPDIIVRPTLGVIYSLSTKKISEHGGLSDEDRKVACFVSSPTLMNKGRKFAGLTSTKQVAPTILKVLGLDVNALQGAKAEGTKVLEGFGAEVPKEKEKEDDGGKDD